MGGESRRVGSNKKREKKNIIWHCANRRRKRKGELAGLVKGTPKVLLQCCRLVYAMTYILPGIYSVLGDDTPPLDAPSLQRSSSNAPSPGEAV